VAKNRNPKGKATEAGEAPAAAPFKHPSVAWARFGQLVAISLRDWQAKVGATLRGKVERLTPRRREDLASVMRDLDACRKLVQSARAYETRFEAKAGVTWEVSNPDVCAGLPGYKSYRAAIDAERRTLGTRKAAREEFCLFVRDGACVGYGHRTKGSGEPFLRHFLA
jgi:hypothetical protein